jgi:hypothetical protein
MIDCKNARCGELKNYHYDCHSVPLLNPLLSQLNAIQILIYLFCVISPYRTSHLSKNELNIWFNMYIRNFITA